MNDSLCSLKKCTRLKHHSNCHTVTGKQILKHQQMSIPEKSSSALRIRRQNSLVDNEEICMLEKF